MERERGNARDVGAWQEPKAEQGANKQAPAERPGLRAVPENAGAKEEQKGGDLASAYAAAKGLKKEAGGRAGTAREAFEQVAEAQMAALKNKLMDAALDELRVQDDERPWLKAELLKQDFWKQMDTLMSGPQESGKAVAKMQERILERAKNIRVAATKRKEYRKKPDAEKGAA